MFQMLFRSKALKVRKPFAAALLSVALAAGSVAFAASSSQTPLAEQARRACVTVRSALLGPGGRVAATATGSGFFVGSDLVLTCNHVTKIPMSPRRAVAADQVSIELDTGDMTAATVIARDEDHDLALLRLSGNGRFGAEPLSISNYSLSRGTQYTIVGDFPDAIRVTKGRVMTESVMPGFAMGDAKVRSGFSGGPVLDPDGNVQGILSQRDMQNNSIFVRPEAILSLMRRVGATPVPAIGRQAPDELDNSDTAIASASGSRRSSVPRGNELSVAPATKTAAPKSRRSDLAEAALASVADNKPAPSRAASKLQSAKSSTPSATKPASMVLTAASINTNSALSARPAVTIPASTIETTYSPLGARIASAARVEEEPVVVAIPVRRTTAR